MATSAKARASLDMDALLSSGVEVRVQHPDLGDAVDGELVGLGGPADGLGPGARE
jgi:hypothetical protein